MRRPGCPVSDRRCPASCLPCFVEWLSEPAEGPHRRAQRTPASQGGLARVGRDVPARSQQPPQSMLAGRLEAEISARSSRPWGGAIRGRGQACRHRH